MNKNAIHNLSNIIYKIYNIADFDEMRCEVLAAVKALIPCTCGNIMMADDTDSKHRLYDAVCFPEKYQKMGDLYVGMQEEDYSLWVLQRKQSKVIRDTDLMYDQEWMDTSLYKKCFAPFGIHYTIDMTITYSQGLLGVLSLYRSEEEGDFTDEDVFFLEVISEHLNARFAEEKDSDVKKQDRGILSYVKQYNLTARETEILEMIFDAKTNDEISGMLCISSNTLKKHLQNIYRKTGVANRMQLMSL